MSYNGSGTFQINTSGQPVVTGTVISSSAFNALTADLATGLSTAITKDGQTATTVRIPFAQGINSSLTTDATNTTTGSIITAGGVGIAKALNVGTNATIVGTLGVTGTATFSATPVFSALTASSAVATDASKNLVSVTNTGTGNNVLATSPTITTPTISSLTSAAATALTLKSAGTTAVTVDTSQNVGIGTTSPSVKFQVNHSSDVAAINASGGGVTLGMSNSSANDVLLRMTNNSSNFYDIRNLTSGSAFTIGYNGDERMRIDSSGHVLINATSTGSFSAGAKLSVLGVATEFAAVFRAPDTGSYNVLSCDNPNGQVGKIQTSGSATSFLTSSDYRLKENIAPMTEALAKVAALKPVTYKWKVDGTDGQGFIAHELAEVVPDCVGGEKDAVDANGNPQYQGVDTSFLVATLTAAMQEQQALITSLTARITALEAK